MTLYHCSPLSAKISKVSCKANKQRGVFAREKCPGLGDETKLETEESKMANALCNTKGCNKLGVVGGFCTSHADPAQIAEKNKRIRERRAAAKNIIAPMAKVDTVTVPFAGSIPNAPITETIPIPLGHEQPVTTREIGIINLLQVFRQKRETDLNTELLELSNDLDALTEPYDQMIFVLDRMRS
jgi:hypothetical protein